MHVGCHRGTPTFEASGETGCRRTAAPGLLIRVLMVRGKPASCASCLGWICANGVKPGEVAPSNQGWLMFVSEQTATEGPTHLPRVQRFGSPVTVSSPAGHQDLRILMTCGMGDVVPKPPEAGSMWECLQRSCHGKHSPASMFAPSRRV